MCMRRAPNSQGKLMPEWEEISAVAGAAQNMQLMATSLGVACELSPTPSNTPLVYVHAMGTTPWAMRTHFTEYAPVCS